MQPGHRHIQVHRLSMPYWDCGLGGDIEAIVLIDIFKTYFRCHPFRVIMDAIAPGGEEAQFATAFMDYLKIPFVYQPVVVMAQ